MGILYDKKHLRQLADKHCARVPTSITRELGHGTQGIVFQTEINTAVKVHSKEAGYIREKTTYQRLAERKISKIQEFVIPRLMDWDDGLLTLEMSIVHVPCILDFGGAYVDSIPDHCIRDEEWKAQKADEFGDNWERAKAIIGEFEARSDVTLVDVNTGNIKFPPDPR